MRTDYCPIANEPCQSMCMDGCNIQSHNKKLKDLRAENNTLRAQLAEAQKDADRGRFMIKHGSWHRGEEQTHLSVLVPQGSDLSCYATREASIDAAMQSSQEKV